MWTARLAAASLCHRSPLATPFGSMHGTYQMVTPRGDLFDVEIAPFALSEPYSVN